MEWATKPPPPGISYGIPKAAQNHAIKVLREPDKYSGILPQTLTVSVGTGVAVSLGVILSGSLSIMLAPVLTRDNLSKMRQLQYSSRKGRKLLRTQFWAILTVAALIAATEIGVTFAVFIKAAWGPFLHTRLNSVMSESLFWYTGTVGDWLTIIAVTLFALALAVTCIVFLLSNLSKNYIALLLCVVPMVAAFFTLSYGGLQYPFALWGAQTPLYSITKVPWSEAVACGALLGIGGALAGWMIKKNRRAEV